MLSGGEKSENIRMKIMEGSIYTVDEVSDLLGIPRPTLYRYLREYSIPHLRREGRISIPEDSFDRIREARDLHKEGLGTETVRRQLREGTGPDANDLDRRLDGLHETLQSLQGDLRDKPATSDEVALSPTLRTILARQSLMLSAMFNLTGMVEDLLVASGKPRRTVFEDLRVEPGRTASLPGGPAEGRLRIPGPTATAEPSVRESPSPARVPPRSDDNASFGTLGRRRRHAIAAVLSLALVGVCLALLLPTLGTGGDAETARSEAPRQAPGNGDAQEGAEQARAESEADGNVAGSAPERDPSEEGQVRSTASGPADQVDVPDVTGRGLEEAARAISEAGFKVATVRVEAGPEEPGTVTGTEPAAGTDARSGAPVVLVASGGPDGTPRDAASASSSASASASASPAP